MSVIVPNKATQTRTSVTMKPMHATEQMKSTMRGETQNPKSSHLTGNPYLSHRIVQSRFTADIRHVWIRFPAE